MTPDLLRPLKDMAKIRAVRAEQQAAQNAAALAQQMGGSMAALGKAPKEIQQAVISQFPGTAAG